MACLVGGGLPEAGLLQGLAYRDLGDGDVDLEWYPAATTVSRGRGGFPTCTGRGSLWLIVQVVASITVDAGGRDPDRAHVVITVDNFQMQAALDELTEAFASVAGGM